MAIEIERKFLLKNDNWRDSVERSQHIAQGYISRSDTTGVRVRVKGEKAEFNVKHSLDGIHRLEYEYEVPVADALEMLEKVALPSVIDKTRHYITLGKHLWEIDEFAGDNAGLIVAEIELSDADEAFERPEWLGEEVSQDQRYFNSNLSETPFNQW